MELFLSALCGGAVLLTLGGKLGLFPRRLGDSIPLFRDMIVPLPRVLFVVWTLLLPWQL